MREPRIAHYKEIEELPVKVEGARDITIRWLISDRDGAVNFQMRLFEVAPGGGTPLHEHPWEHEIFVLRGSGKVLLERGEKPIEEGFFLYIPAGTMHSFVNAGTETFQFLCMVPKGVK